MSDHDEPTAGDTPSRETSYQSRREAANEQARKLRKEAYQRAKELSKAQRLERQNTPEANERKLRMREMRRQAYLKAKEAYKVRVAERSAQDREREQREAEEAKALRDADLLSGLKTGDNVKPKSPKLRLVKPGDAF